MSSSIFCNPINPHTEKVDDNCVVFFQDSPYPNIIFRPTLGILKPYFVSPIKNLNYRTPLYYIPANQNFPEYYLYEYYNNIINKIVTPQDDSGCNTPDFSDNNSINSDELESNCIELPTKPVFKDHCIQISVSKNDKGIQYDYFNDVNNNLKYKYLRVKYFNLWKSNLNICIQNKKTERRKNKKDRQLKKKLLKKNTVIHWSKICTYQTHLKSKYFKIWYYNFKINKSRKFKCIIQWKKCIVYKKNLISNFFKIWKLYVEKKQIKKQIKKIIIEKWTYTINKNKELYTKYFNIWKKNIFKSDKSIIKKVCDRKYLKQLDQPIYDKKIVSILKYLTFDTFQDIIEIIPSFSYYLDHPEIKDTYAYYLNYQELFYRKLIKFSILNLQNQLKHTKLCIYDNIDLILYPDNITELNKLSDDRIIADSIRNMYDCRALNNSISSDNLNSIYDIKHKNYIYDFIKNDVSVKQDVYLMLLGDYIIITKFCYGSKNFIEYYCDPIKYIEIIIQEICNYLKKLKIIMIHHILKIIIIILF